MSGNAQSSTSKPSSSAPARNASLEGKRDSVDKLRTAVGAVSTARKLKAAASSSNSKKQQQTKEEDRDDIIRAQTYLTLTPRKLITKPLKLGFVDTLKIFTIELEI
ncbi:hypothetical protein PNOK_0755700 [Pyrrhoderma noxium]|uniref:Uncharacterized protein n=1 Tax=Pyrrhoderma noxium TaxID=2282107 RepID=A0A286UD30_9AGAM|nr:hypothetical protein PNOK_0755700 [Pyrrhoderma noxium]